MHLTTALYIHMHTYTCQHRGRTEDMREIIDKEGIHVHLTTALYIHMHTYTCQHRGRTEEMREIIAKEGALVNKPDDAGKYAGARFVCFRMGHVCMYVCVCCVCEIAACMCM
jgi:hypothetical protein